MAGLILPGLMRERRQREREVWNQVMATSQLSQEKRRKQGHMREEDYGPKGFDNESLVSDILGALINCRQSDLSSRSTAVIFSSIVLDVCIRATIKPMSPSPCITDLHIEKSREFKPLQRNQSIQLTIYE